MSAFSSLDLGGGDPSSTDSFAPDPHAVSNEEALSYYAGLPSKPTLLYRTGKEWSPPRGPEAQCCRKELCEVFKHPMANLWNDGLCWEVAKAMDTHNVFFTTMDVIRFRMVEVDEAPSDEEDVNEEAVEAEAKKPVVSPVTIWVGVYPDTTSATAAYNAAQAVLALLRGHEITDVDVDFRESFYSLKAGPQLLKPVDDLNPLVDVISPLTPALGLHISTGSQAQGTMGLYLAKGGGSNKLLGLTCRHLLFGPMEANVDYIRRRSAPTKKVLLLGERAYTNLIDSIKLRIGQHTIAAERWGEQIKGFEEREKGTDTDDVEKARKDRVKTQTLLDDAEAATEALGALLSQVKKYWRKLENRVLGCVLRSPAITLGAGEHGFTEDWGIFRINRAKLGVGFQGNKINLGTKLPADKFTAKCFPCGDANWRFKYPGDRLLPLQGTITDKLMRTPDMWDLDGKPCLLVVKNGSATGITLGRANGVYSIVREYWYLDMSFKETSMEWGIINYDSKSEVFSDPGDSGSIIADIRGRIGGLLTGGSGKTHSSDLTYATPFWWLFERIKANGFPNAHLNVVE